MSEVMFKGLLHAPADLKTGTGGVHFETEMYASEVILLRALANEALKCMVNDTNPNVPWQTKGTHTKLPVKDLLVVVQEYADSTSDEKILADWAALRPNAGHRVFRRDASSMLEHRPVISLAGEKGYERVTAS